MFDYLWRERVIRPGVASSESSRFRFLLSSNLCSDGFSVDAANPISFEEYIAEGAAPLNAGVVFLLSGIYPYR